MTEIDRRRLGVFVGSLMVLAAGTSAVVMTTDVDIWPVSFFYMLTPTIAGLAVCLYGGVSVSEIGLRRGRPRWLVVASVLALGLVTLTVPVSLLVPGVEFGVDSRYFVLRMWSVDLPDGIVGAFAALGLAVLSGATLEALFGFGEEFGWRGYLLWELAPLGFWTASGAIGVVWALWHAPAAFVWGPNSGAWYAMLAWMVSLPAVSPLYTYLVVRAESVFAAALFHGVFNAAVGLIGMVVASAGGFLLSQLVVGPVGLVGVVTFGAVAAALAIVGSPELSRDFAREQ